MSFVLNFGLKTAKTPDFNGQALSASGFRFPVSGFRPPAPPGISNRIGCGVKR
jgi:hypothetical protein